MRAAGGVGEAVWSVRLEQHFDILPFAAATLQERPHAEAAPELETVELHPGSLFISGGWDSIQESVEACAMDPFPLAFSKLLGWDEVLA